MGTTISLRFNDYERFFIAREKETINLVLNDW